MDYSSDTHCVFRVYLYDKSKNIIFEKKDVCNFDYFIRVVLREFGIDPDSKGSVVLWDQENVLIPEEAYSIMVLQYLHCNSFSIKLGIKSDPNEPLLVQELKYFLLQNGCRGAFIESESNEDNNHQLTDETVQFITDKLMDFINLNYSMYKWTDIEDVCKAAVILFPYIEIERLIDSKKKKGAIYHKVCYFKYKKPQKRKQHQNTEDANEEVLVFDHNSNSPGCEQDEIDELSYLLYFKTCIVERDIEILKIKLSQTIEMRESLIKKKGTDFHKAFPFYFLQPNLILYDYEIRKKSLDPSALFLKWPTIKAEILVCVKAVERDTCLNYFDEDIGYFVALLKLMASNRANLNEIVSKFIVYSQEVNDDPKNVMDPSNHYPHIIAIGEKKNEIKCFYIAVEKQIVPVPTDFKIEQVYDLYFKLHHVFNIKYNPILKNMMVFMERFIYGIEESDVSATVSRWARKFMPK